MATSGKFTVSGTDYEFEVNADEVDEELTAEIDEELMLGGSTVYVTIGGVNAPHKSLSLYFATAAAYATFKQSCTGKQGTLVTTRDGTETAILHSVRRTKRNWNGQTDCATTWTVIS